MAVRRCCPSVHQRGFGRQPSLWKSRLDAWRRTVRKALIVASVAIPTAVAPVLAAPVGPPADKGPQGVLAHGDDHSSKGSDSPKARGPAVGVAPRPAGGKAPGRQRNPVVTFLLRGTLTKLTLDKSAASVPSQGPAPVKLASITVSVKSANKHMRRALRSQAVSIKERGKKHHARSVRSAEIAIGTGTRIRLVGPARARAEGGQSNGVQSGKPLLIIAEDVEGEALATYLQEKDRVMVRFRSERFMKAEDGSYSYRPLSELGVARFIKNLGPHPGRARGA